MNVDLLTSPWVTMWVVAFAIYVACKAISLREINFGRIDTRMIGYLIAWPGMDARSFLDRGENELIPTISFREWIGPLCKLILGLCLLYMGAQNISAYSILLAGWTGIVGFVLTLHFGIFGLLTLFWQRHGVNVAPIMNRPAIACSVGEFWGNRWNRAFRDLTHRFLFRPLRTKVGAIGALLIGFVVSGVIHELAITVPAQSGYGGPTIYFLIQSVAILIERSRLGLRIGLRSQFRGWLYTCAALVGPIGLLIPNDFVTKVAIPFFQAIGAMP